jgi:1-deoxy-D-xylulose-5-phosphate synthase
MFLNHQNTLLSSVNSPDDMKNFDSEQLIQLSQELRQFIINHVSIHGGHFAANLGVIELTVALHHVFDLPNDKLIWDVGHQAYGHKILTGRREAFLTNRSLGGISGFPKREESEFDAFGAGHSSTSISAALGMAVASSIKNDFSKHHVAIIGDGAITAGMAFEAMNHAGSLSEDLLIILNDNGMSIDPNVGALKEYLIDITTSNTYNGLKDSVHNFLKTKGTLGLSEKVLSKIESLLKSLLIRQSNYFESLKIRYFGPIDGHDVVYLTNVLNDLKKIKGPKILHCVTTKGKGFEPAEKNQTKWHFPGKFDKITGDFEEKIFTRPEPPTYQEVFGKTLLDLAEKNKNIVGVTPAMLSGSAMNIMKAAMPDRVFDVGIAEQHAVTFSAGMATQGLVVFCHVYSTFMQRAYDQVIHDVCLQKLPVIFCLDRAGLVGPDGATHHGAFDLAYMRCIPNLIVAAPMDEIELRNMMYTFQLPENQLLGKAFVIRYPRSKGVNIVWEKPLQKMEIGEGVCLREGTNFAILSIGQTGNIASKACDLLLKEGLQVAHYDLRFVKPLGEDLLHSIFQKYTYILTIEDGCLLGGFGSAITEFVVEHQYNPVLKRLGIPDIFIEHGEQTQLHNLCGFSAEQIIDTVLEMTEKFQSNLQMS